MPFQVGHKQIPVAPKNPVVRDLCNPDNPVGAVVNDVFFDNGADELLTTHRIIDLIGIHDPNFITITFDKKFLKRILKSHISHIRALNAD